MKVCNMCKVEKDECEFYKNLQHKNRLRSCCKNCIKLNKMVVKCYTYKIINLINGKLYIGQTNNPKRRWRDHRCDALTRKKNHPLYNAMRKYGIDNFSFEIIKEYDNLDNNNLDACNLDEILLIYITDSLVEIGKGYNLEIGGNKSPCSPESSQKLSKAGYGRKHSEETKKKISESHKGMWSGEKNPWFGKGKEIFGINNPNYGRHHSEESKKKISNAHTQVSPKQFEEMKELRAKGLSYVKIGKIVGFSGTTVQKRLKGLIGPTHCEI